MRRRRFRQDRGGDTRRLQGCGRRQADGRASADDSARLSTLPHILRTSQRVAREGRLSLARTHGQAGQADSQRTCRGEDRHPHRNPQNHRQGGEIQGPRAAHHRRGAEIRRGRQGETQADEGQCRHSDHERDPHPAHPPVFTHGSARPLGHQHPSAQPLSHHHIGQRRERRHHQRGGQL